jgi:flagellar hook-length control protein FliK
MILAADAPAPTAPPPADASVSPSPAPQQIQAEQAAPAQAPRRPVNEEVGLPRRAGDTRKRAETRAIDAPSGAPHQRVAEPASAPVHEAGAPPTKGDAVVEQTLTVARDGAWLDTLARDIASSAGNGSDLKFKLDPQNLGSLTVAISQSEDGASIRMTADNDTTRNLLIDAQPKLIAEARAQGLKVSDTHVDLKQDPGQSQRGSESASQNQSQNQGQTQSSGQDASRWAQGNAGQNATAQNGQNRQSSPGHQPFVSNLGLKADAESESREGDSDALYA